MINYYRFGEVSEWSKVHAWKACGVRAPAGSNPVLSAKKQLILSKLFKKEIHMKTVNFSDIVIYQIVRLNEEKGTTCLKKQEIDSFVNSFENNIKRIGTERCCVINERNLKEDIQYFCLYERGNIILKENYPKDRFINRIGALEHEVIKALTLSMKECGDQKE